MELREQVARALATALTGGYPSKPKSIDYAAADAAIAIVRSATLREAAKVAEDHARLWSDEDVVSAFGRMQAAILSLGANHDQ